MKRVDDVVGIVRRKSATPQERGNFAAIGVGSRTQLNVFGDLHLTLSPDSALARHVNPEARLSVVSQGVWTRLDRHFSWCGVTAGNATA
ncbi:MULTISPECIES: hypothetical protein [Ralstonia solanacearum species complex]|uniref:hypothetical protein n=1 Tax=Ralstonia solanacearum species complex TaxID=3116862 RepID=UPI001E63993D|nr:hypothetical protein [Ralstonia solanacearum]MDN4065764.1 hypothetical protein [Ralstonia solanacearum]